MRPRWNTVTSCPAATAASTACRPTNDVPPTNSSFMAACGATPVSRRLTSSSDSDGDEHDHLVTGAQHRVAAGHDEPVLAQHGDDRGVAGHPEVLDRLAVDRRSLGEAHLGQPGPATLEREQADERPDGDRLLDEGGEQVRRRHADVDAPDLVEHPLVLRVVDPGDDAWHAELLLRQQGDDEVVLVVAGDGGDDVGFGHPDVGEGGISQASPSYQCTPAGSPPRRARATTSRSLSMIVTSWPSSWSSSAMNRPTLPPPAMITRISDLPAQLRRRGLRGSRRQRRRRPTRTAGRPPGRPCSPSARGRRRGDRGRRRGSSSPPRGR